MPLELKAAQLIYANVEREQSPSRRRGFQTLYHTRKDEVDRLTNSEVLELETRLSHEAKGNAGSRHVFLRTKGGKFVLIQFLPLTETDKFGRTGRYFAHALIFRQESFASLACNPFAGFEAANSPFASSLEQAIALGEFATGDILPATLECPEGSPGASEPWGESLDPSALRWIVLAASQSKKLVASRRVVTLRGEPQEVFAFLRGLFARIPAEFRQSCTFDTAASERTAERPGQWAAGLAEASARRTGLLLFPIGGDGFSPRIPLKPESPFDRWAVLEDGQMPAPRLRSAQAAHDLMIALEANDPSKIPSDVSEVIDDYYTSNREELDKALPAKIQHVIQAEPPSWLVEQARRWMANPDAGIERARAWMSGPPANRVIGWIVHRQLRRILEVEPPAWLVEKSREWMAAAARSGVLAGSWLIEPSAARISGWIVARLSNMPDDRREFDLGKLLEKLRGVDNYETRFLSIAVDRFARDWDRLSFQMNGSLRLDPYVWDRLAGWLILSAVESIQPRVFQLDGLVTFGCLARGADREEMSSAYKILDALNQGSLRDANALRYEIISYHSVPIPAEYCDKWTNVAESVVFTMRKLEGLGWRFLPLDEGFFFGLDYHPPGNMAGNVENMVGNFGVERFCRGGAIPGGSGPAGTEIARSDHYCYPIDNVHCLTLFNLLCRHIMRS